MILEIIKAIATKLFPLISAFVNSTKFNQLKYNHLQIHFAIELTSIPIDKSFQKKPETFEKQIESTWKTQ